MNRSKLALARTSALLGLLVAASMLGPMAASVSAQQQVPSPSEIRNLSRQEIIRRIRSSGLSEAQIRDRLRQAGYDPALANRYFGEDLGQEGLLETGPEDAEFLGVLRSLGIALRAPVDSLGVPLDSLLAEEFADSLEMAKDTIEELEVFGRDVFRRRTTEFSAALTGPVGPDYPLGPGDEVILILTGDVELAYRLDVTREGSLVIPDVGQVSVTGLTVGQLEDRLYDRLGQVYSGISREPDASTRFNVALGQLRSSQVYVVGEVERPGAYRVSSVATVLEALYAAGGPRETGSFRSVVLRRAGRAVGDFDLYRYLTAGETPAALRVQEGDVVFVPARGPQVAVVGEVLREALYEIVDGEGLPELVRYVGGLKSSARTDVIRVDRILPRSERTVGRDRAVFDVDLDALEEGRASFEVRGGDSITVFPVLEESRGWVEVDGAVYRPGRYEWIEGSSVADLIDDAGGALPDVLGSAVQVSSLDLTNGSRSMVRVPMDVAPSVPLREFDQVRLFGVDSLLAPDSVAVYGFVNEPGRYPLSLGATPEDVILVAGGLAFGADPRQAEVSRLIRGASDGVRTSQSQIVALSELIPYPGPVIRDSLPGLESAVVPASDVRLLPEDEVFVRQLPQFRRPLRVEVSGEVVTPGTYVLESVDERLTSVLSRAGGLTDRAYPQGFRLIRDGITVGVDLPRAIERPMEDDDPVLQAGDRLVVPVYDPTVLVTGAVAFETRVVFRPGLSLGDVISQAGGVTSEADKARISVEYANGSRSTVKRFLGMTYSSPGVRPGSRVFVPEAPESEEGFNWDAALSRILAIGSTLATLIIATR